MEFDELMKGFAAKAGVTNFAPDADGVYQVEIDDMGVAFAEVAETRQLLTWADVGEPPPDGRERLYSVLLEATNLGKATGGATFSLDPETGRVRLFRLDPLPFLDQETFVATLEKFVNVLERWRKVVADFSDSASDVVAKEESASAESRQMGMSGFLQV